MNGSGFAPGLSQIIPKTTTRATTPVNAKFGHLRIKQIQQGSSFRAALLFPRTALNSGNLRGRVGARGRHSLATIRMVPLSNFSPRMNRLSKLIGSRPEGSWAAAWTITSRLSARCHPARCGARRIRGLRYPSVQRGQSENFVGSRRTGLRRATKELVSDKRNDEVKATAT
jgi:hypothetical protein